MRTAASGTWAATTAVSASSSEPRRRRRPMANAQRIKVAAVGDMAAGEAKVVEAGGKSLALFNVDGAWYAIDNTCPHRGGPLGEGDLDGRVVTCPWHAWRWGVTTGANLNNPAVRVACFPVIIEQDTVYVEVG